MIQYYSLPLSPLTTSSLLFACMFDFWLLTFSSPTHKRLEKSWSGVNKGKTSSAALFFSENKGPYPSIH